MTLYEDEKPPLSFHNVVWTGSVSKSKPEEIGLYAHEEGVDFIPREMWPDAIK
jgi:hypothetical protein